jgi:hypothetical protein
MFLYRLLSSAPLILLLGCGAWNGAPRLDAHTLKLLQAATKVEVFRVHGGPPQDNLKHLDNLSISGYPVLAKGTDQGQDLASRLAAILHDRHTYSNGWAGCFSPGVAFRAWKDDECIDVVICFKCNNLYCGPPKASAGENVSFLGTPARARLMQLAKEAFPDDKEIQELQ